MAPEMTNAEAIDMMQRCKHEIMDLKRTIDKLRPKAEAYDNIATILCLLPQQGVGMSEDIVWTLEKRIKELTPKPVENEIGPGAM